MNKEIESILDHSLEYAKGLLVEHKEFYPFGAFTDKTGQVHPLEFDVDTKNIPNNGKVIDTLEKYCSKELQESRLTGYGLTFEVQLQLSEDSPVVDAIAIEIYHANEENIPMYYLPYSIQDDEVSFDSVFAVKK